MTCIKVQTIRQAHEAMIRYVINRHRVVEITELKPDGQDKVWATWESDPIMVMVEDPLRDMIHPNSNFQQARCDIYADQIIKGIKSDFDYTYYERLNEWGKDYGPAYGLDQISNILAMLRILPSSRRAIANTWDPQGDDDPYTSAPCLQMVQCLIRNGRLNMIVTFRSNDILSAAGSNMYGLVRLQECIAGWLHCPVGSYTHIATVPHIYPVRDASELQRWKRW